MRRSIRKAGVACGAAFASAALAMTTSTGASAVTTAVAVGGLGTPDMHEVVIAPLLGGKLARENDILDGVEWPAQAKRPGTGNTLGQSITQGIASLSDHFDDALARLEAGEQFTVVGFSAGSLVVNDFMRELASDPNAPTKSQVKFILVADSSRQKLLSGSSKYNPQYDYTYRPAPATAYDIDVVTGEYDGAADLPDRWWNFLAVANAIAGGIFVHVPMMFANYEDPNVARVLSTETNDLGGVTTTYLVKAKTLPLVQLLPFLKSQEASLKAKIDAGYSRNDTVATATFAARSAAVPEAAVANAAAPEADDAAVAPEAADAVSTEVEDDADVKGTKDAAESDSDAGDSHSRTTKASKNEEDADEDAEASKSDEDEAEAAEDADKADSVAAKDDEDDKDADSTDPGSSVGSSSGETGSSDPGSSQ
ncbi:PE-PPE domain-containing protein [Mycolicibacterium iranicum]|uniref:PE-PPE domain-containing protein n=1 Tax=Mycolicibacterium iranicum TaxID=912594 RepID=A0A1X1W9E3_MYCIR|nr:PE-PPE domain-containing protein [Mycolicibacterium iranicum]ORV83227.1 PE-PPE domain-containing protein [Mycolicibacterium iranicum]